MPLEGNRGTWEDSGPMDGKDGPGFGAMIGLVAVVVAAVILVFFGIGYALGRLFL
jgi:PGF-CTERM protein